MSKHPIIHVELSTHDREASGKFYADVFGWEIRQIPEMNYATFRTGEGVGGGLNPISDSNPAGTITFYIETDDVDVTLKDIAAHGGKILAEKLEIPGVGWFGVFQDPSGNIVSLLKPLPMDS
jgi:uncharacterized protein